MGRAVEDQIKEALMKTLIIENKKGIPFAVERIRQICEDYAKEHLKKVCDNK